MSKFAVHYDPDSMDGIADKSPFNLKKDIKDISLQELDAIAEEIANELIQGYNHKPVIIEYITQPRDAAWAKIRTMDIKRGAGKSNGYRCILLLDLINEHAFLLHIYRHGHGEDKNISKKEKSHLKALVDEYSKSLKESKKVQ